MRMRLEAVGIRPINSVVDIANFVMLEVGQPLRVFDADKLIGGIEVRLARPNEEMLALDGRRYASVGRRIFSSRMPVTPLGSPG